MESAGIEFQRKQALVRGDLHLVDRGRVAPGKESILIGIVFSILAVVAAPDEAFDVGKRTSLRKLDLPHCFTDVEQRKRLLLLIEKLVVAASRGGGLRAIAEKRIHPAHPIPAGIDETETRVLRNQHHINNADELV